MTVKDAEAIINRLNGNRALYEAGAVVRADGKRKRTISAYSADMTISALEHETPGQRIDRIRAHFAKHPTRTAVVRCATRVVH